MGNWGEFAFQGAEVRVCVSQVALTSGLCSCDRLAAIHALGVRMPPAVDWAELVAVPSFITAGLMVVPLMSLQDPRPRAGLEGLLPPIPLGPDLPYREECRPHPQPCPDSCLRFYCFRSLPYMEVGLPASPGERLEPEFVSPQLTDTPGSHFKSVFI